MCPGSRRRCRRMPRAASTACTSSTIAGLPHSIACALSAVSASPARASSRPSAMSAGMRPGKRARDAASRLTTGTNANAPGCARRDRRDHVAVGEIGGDAHRVHEHDAPELLPRLRRAQDRQERPDAGAGRRGTTARRPPGTSAIVKNPLALGRSQTGSPGRERREPRRQRPFGHDDEVELVGRRAGRIHERIGPADHLLLRARRRRQREAAELARRRTSPRAPSTSSDTRRSVQCCLPATRPPPTCSSGESRQTVRLPLCQPRRGAPRHRFPQRCPRVPAPAAAPRRRRVSRRRRARAGACTAAGCGAAGAAGVSRLRRALRRARAAQSARGDARRLPRPPQRRRRDRRRLQLQRDRPRLVPQRVPRLLRVRAARRRGLHGGGLALALDLAFRTLGLHRVEANVQPEQRALARARAARRLRPRRLFAALPEDRRPLARPRALRDAGRGLARAADARDDCAAPTQRRARRRRARARVLARSACAATPAHRSTRPRPSRAHAADALRDPRGMRAHRRAATGSTTRSTRRSPWPSSIRYREGAVGARADRASGIAATPASTSRPSRADYCLAWEAGAAGTLLDYRLRLRAEAPRRRHRARATASIRTTRGTAVATDVTPRMQRARVVAVLGATAARRARAAAPMRGRTRRACCASRSRA